MEHQSMYRIMHKKHRYCLQLIMVYLSSIMVSALLIHSFDFFKEIRTLRIYSLKTEQPLKIWNNMWSMTNRSYTGPPKKVIYCNNSETNASIKPFTNELFGNLGYWGIADLLVSNGIDVDLPDAYGKSALQWAAGSG